MSSSHYDKWFFKTPIGFLLTTGGIFFMYYSLLHLPKDKWVTFGLISAFAVGFGVYFLCSAAIHKMKSDMMKKQKLKQQSG